MIWCMLLVFGFTWSTSDDGWHRLTGLSPPADLTDRPRCVRRLTSSERTPDDASTLMLRLDKCIIILVRESSPPSVPPLVYALFRPLSRKARGRGSRCPHGSSHTKRIRYDLFSCIEVSPPRTNQPSGELVPSGETYLKLRHESTNAYPTAVYRRVGVVLA